MYSEAFVVPVTAPCILRPAAFSSTSHTDMGFRSLFRDRANSLRLPRPKVRAPPPRTLTAIPRRCATACAATEEEDSTSPVQGPSQAPTEKGVSTAGLNEVESKLLEAAYKSDIDGITNALQSGADINTRDVNGRTCLHFCAGNGLNALVRDLGMKGAIIDQQDLLGFTPLHMAAGYKRAACVRSLLDLGADANITANDGRLPVEIAEQILEKTPKKRFFMENQEYGKLKEIVTLLDDATELEDDDDEDDDNVDGEYQLVDNVQEDASSTDDPQKEEEEDKVEKVGDTTFTVRVKSSSDRKATAAKPNVDDTNIKITIKEPGSSK